jgi:hypothetical protein
MDPLDRSYQDPPRRRRRGLLVLALAGTALVTFGASAISLALFTDTAASTGTFTTGTIDITSSPSTAFTVSGMMPGDESSATLTIENAGTAQFRYAMSSSSTNIDGQGLAAQLQLAVREGACPSTGTVVSSGSLDAAAFGSAATGADTGDRVLDGAASEDLCFTVSLPSATGPSYMGAATTTTFTFDAEQTANN